ncbi:MAG TPA: nicotinate-nucleotide adenylyltransferase [Terriglobia bacterium]|nr:nicotinate-nucleotide adenylyltransferase [Terriglobia bacterium]
MNVALFGGTFDPIHVGHIRAAQAAARRFRLDRIFFVPSGVPPHKPNGEVTPFPHRYAMVALAVRRQAKFVPSLMEAPRPDGWPNYAVETVSAARSMIGSRDHLYFILGIDSFLDLPNWKNYQRLSELTDFIVAARPGFGSRELLARIGNGHSGTVLSKTGTSLRLPSGAGVHVLSGLHSPVASREIRQAAAAGRPLAGLVPPLVEEYIVKEDLYRAARTRRRAGRGGQ